MAVMRVHMMVGNLAAQMDYLMAETKVALKVVRTADMTVDSTAVHWVDSRVVLWV